VGSRGEAVEHLHDGDDGEDAGDEGDDARVVGEEEG
jgi:hypothetical protein